MFNEVDNKLTAGGAVVDTDSCITIFDLLVLGIFTFAWDRNSMPLHIAKGKMNENFFLHESTIIFN